MATHRSRRASETIFGALRDLLWQIHWGFYLLILCPVFIPSSLWSRWSCAAQSIQSDIGGLMAFKEAADTGGVLSRSWNGFTNPCGVQGSPGWLGISCNERGRVDTVKLPNMQLRGTFPDNTLSRLSELRYLILPNNSFSGSLPRDFANLTGLLQFWAHNAKFSGSLPTLPFRLAMLDLSENNLGGPIPDLSGLINLTRLDLSGNQFHGYIASLPPKIQFLNLSDNSLAGRVPQDLAQRFPTAFAGNAGLCGISTATQCLAVTAPPAVAGADANDKQNSPPSAAGHKLSSLNIVLIAVAPLALILLILGFVKIYCIRGEAVEKKSGKNSGNDRGISTSFGDPESMKLSFLDDNHPNYDLEDLLRASAEMLGKGSLGTAYKAVLDDGSIVAVKRLKDVRDVRDMGKKEFDEHMQMLGSLRHPGLVPLRAYYFARDERLVICDFMPNGSLFSLLHGSRGPGRTPLEWPARLNIAASIARGLTYLHQECKSLKVPHGNLKSSNVLIGKDFEVQIADFGLVSLMTPATAARRMAGYRAPEYHHARKISHKADVYSFGVLLLELLTGRQPAVSCEGDGIDLPRWVQSVVREEWTGEVFDLELKSYLHGEEGMVSLLQIAMACVTSIPEKRPDMAEVLEMVEGIGVVEYIVDSESVNSHSNSSDEDLSSQEAPPSDHVTSGKPTLRTEQEQEQRDENLHVQEKRGRVHEDGGRELDLEEQGEGNANRNHGSPELFDV